MHFNDGSIFWKAKLLIFNQLSLSFFWTRTFLSEKLVKSESRIFLNLNSFLVFAVAITNLICRCERRIIDEQIVENCVDIDRSEAGKYKLVHVSCVFSLPLFQANILTVFIKNHVYFVDVIFTKFKEAKMKKVKSGLFTVEDVIFYALNRFKVRLLRSRLLSRKWTKLQWVIIWS